MAGRGKLDVFMVSPHLLRPFTARQLSLVEGEGRVLAFSVLGGRFVGPSVQVHAPTLAHRVVHLPEQIDTVVFFDEPVPDAAMVSLVDDMLEAFDRVPAEVLARYSDATEAVKRVAGGVVVEGIDRSSLVVVRCPEVIGREALERAVASLSDEMWVNPTALAAASGASVSIYGSGERTKTAG